MQNANISENGKRVNARNTSVDHVIGGFRALKNVGIGFGLLPISTIGYSMSNESTYTTSTGEATQTDTYSGDGGVHEVFLGFGWRPFKGFSLGMNGGFVWGDLTHSVTASFSDANTNSRVRTYDTHVRTYKLDFGVQYEQRVNPRNSFVIGLTYSPGHTIHGRSYYYDQVVVSSTTLGDTVKCKNGLALPDQFGAGFVWNWRNKMRISADYSMQKWSSVSWPVLSADAAGNATYTSEPDQFKDKHTMALGFEYIPDHYGLKWRHHIRYRAGISYSTPYIKVNGEDGPSDLILSANVGLPIINYHTNRCLLNVGLQYERVAPKVSTMVKENYVRFCIGLSFNEEWFRKWRAN